MSQPVVPLPFKAELNFKEKYHYTHFLHLSLCRLYSPFSRFLFARCEGVSESPLPVPIQKLRFVHLAVEQLMTLSLNDMVITTDD